jgi:hypothetical protein
MQDGPLHAPDKHLHIELLALMICQNLIHYARERHSDELAEFGLPSHMSSCRSTDLDVSRL